MADSPVQASKRSRPAAGHRHWIHSELQSLILIRIPSSSSRSGGIMAEELLSGQWAKPKERGRKNTDTGTPLHALSGGLMHH
ncbi:hypothetical protein NQZ68_031237 [Dissostichus eleginoides]|nr:hypothetical protein NQZ68_031237 [Dissostichus eleginoides]